LVPLLAVLFCTLDAPGAQVVIVRSSDAEPYTQAEAALKEQLEARHDTVRRALARDVAERGIRAGIGTADVVVAVGTPAALWLHTQLPPEYKLVYCMVNRAPEAGLLQGRAAWGVTTEVPLPDQLKVIAEALPAARVVGTLYRSDQPDSKDVLKGLSDAMPAGWRVEAVAVNDYPSIGDAIDALTRKNVDVVWTSAEQKTYDTATVRALLLAALRTKTPVWGFSPAFVRAGGLIGVGVNPKAQGAQAAKLVAQLLADPSSPKGRAYPPAEVQIAVNLIVAGRLGIELPEGLTRRAAFVFRPED
jgi:ABC-type uncharacterized transport system substrate-binding protein